MIRVDYAGPGGSCEGIRSLGLESVGFEFDAEDQLSALREAVGVKVGDLVAEIERLRVAIEKHRGEFYEANDYDMAPTRSDEALWAALEEGDET